MRRHDGRPLMIYRPSVVSTQPWQTSSDSPWLLFSQMQQHSTAHAHMTVWHRDGRTLLWLYLKRPTPSHTHRTPLPISASNRVTFSKKDKVAFWTVHRWATTPVVHELICHRKASLWSLRAAIFCQVRRPKACVVCVCGVALTKHAGKHRQRQGGQTTPRRLVWPHAAVVVTTFVAMGTLAAVWPLTSFTY